MKALKDFRKFSLSSKEASDIIGGYIPIYDDGNGDGNGGGGGTGGGTTPKYCCGGCATQVCDSSINVVKVYCLELHLPSPALCS